MRTVKISAPNGLHARPASLLIMECRKFESEITFTKGEQTANAKSIMSVMAMAISANDIIEIHAEGPDANDAIDAIATFLETIED